jgi:hypothetical protein
MKADTFAKLIILETLIDAEIGYFLEDRPPSVEGFREGMIARISDLVDEIDALDAVTAARVYDAIVDFLSSLPEEDEGVIETTIRFKRDIDRVAQRGMDERELAEPSTWAIVLDELLGALTDAYHEAVLASGEVVPREYQRVLMLLARAREAAERMQWEAGTQMRAELRSEMDRLSFAVRHQRLSPPAVDLLIRAPQRRAHKQRPSTLMKIGAFVVGQLLRRSESAPPPRTP